FTATVSPALGSVLPTGTVDFKEGGITLGSGALLDVGGVATATLTTTAAQLLGGSHVITAVYSSDGNYAASTSNGFEQTVNRHATTTTIVSGVPGPSIFGDAVTFTATVTPSLGGVLAGGSVDFKEGNTLLGTGTLSN